MARTPKIAELAEKVEQHDRTLHVIERKIDEARFDKLERHVWGSAQP